LRIFITGGTGFLGSHLLAEAVAAGHSITACKRLESAINFSVPKGINWIVRDLDQIVAEDLKGYDALIHLAAYGVSPQPCLWNEALRVNAAWSLKLVQSAQSAGIPKVVVAGSCHEYGLSANRYDFIPVDAPLEPVSAYGVSKAAFSLCASAYAREVGLNLSIMRIFAVYGEGQNPGNFWPSLRRAAMEGADFKMSEGKQVCDFSPVETIVNGILCSAVNTDRGPRVTNLGTGQAQNLVDFAETWWSRWRASGKLLVGSLPYRQNEIMRYVPRL